MQTQRSDIQRIELKVEVGAIIPEFVKPHSVKYPRGTFPATPEFFIHDPNESRNYVGYLRGLNKLDLHEEHEEDFPGYKLIIREVLPLKDDHGNTIVYLEERIEAGNGVYVLVDGPAKKKDMHGRFLNYESDLTRYAVFIRQENRCIKVNQGERVFGKVLSVNEENPVKPKFDLKPLKIVDKEAFNSNKNRIIRYEDLKLGVD